MRTFKTLQGFYKSCYSQVTVENILSGRTAFKSKSSYKYDTFRLENEALSEFAKLFSTYIYSTKEKQQQVYEAIVSKRGDYSFFQCFYLSQHNGKLCISNSLSGEAFNYCRRKFMKSI